jgi:hypothetical protein
MAQILETTDYQLFKRIKGNRELDPVNINILKKAIQENNKLSVHPIIISKNMYVIDGHHRLQVAEDLQVPVSYLIDQNAENDEEIYQHIITANVNKKNWTLENFLNLYAKKDQNPHYIEFLDLLETLGLRPKGLIGLIIGAQNSAVIHNIKNGTFTLPENKRIYEKITMSYFEFRNFAEERKMKPVSMFTNSNFTNAFRMLLINDSCDVELLFQKLENRWFDLRPQPTAKEWFQLLLNIYNWKNHNKILNEESAKNET